MDRIDTCHHQFARVAEGDVFDLVQIVIAAHLCASSSRVGIKVATTNKLRERWCYEELLKTGGFLRLYGLALPQKLRVENGTNDRQRQRCRHMFACPATGVVQMLISF
eukprot:scaffold5772_cov101-Cylindrotheca_fusiformis.AAC.6